MEYWRPEREVRPEVMSPRAFALALAAHFALFAVFWLFAFFHGLFDKEEEIIPIDLTVVVNENLDGKANEPPPLVKPADPTPAPKVVPKKVEPKKIDEPKPLEQMVIDKTKKVEKKAEPKKVEPKKEEPPKKTAKELREERIKKMRESATKVDAKKVKIEVRNAPSGDGKTERKTLSDAEIQKLLNQGYRPGTSEQIAPNEKSRCISLIQRALNEKWAQMLPATGQTGTVVLSVRLNSAGGLESVRVKRSCGDRTTDAAVVSVAKAVGHISGLGDAFLAQFRTEDLTINYRVN